MRNPDCDSNAKRFTSALCRAEQLRALRNGKRIIPVLVHADADRPLHLEHLHYADMTGEGPQTDDLQELIRRTREEPWTPVPSRFAITYLTVPAVPPHFQPRADVDTIRRTIVSDNPRDSIGTTVIWGMGGVGKTVLAQALCRDAVIQATFPDGVVWTSIGRGAIEPIDQIGEVLKALGEKTASFVNLTDATNRLRGVIRNKACLIVLDDVWDVRSVDAFRVEAPRSQILITARDGSLPSSLGAAQHRLQEFAPTEALAFLASWAGTRPCQNRVKTLCVGAVGDSFERKADSPHC
jgi:NB-ARC domain